MFILCTTWSKGVIWALKVICNIRLKIQIEKDPLPNEPFIIACKHQSVIETIFFQTYLSYPVYIIKKELLRIPFYGTFLTQMGMIPIDRKNGISAIKNIIRLCNNSFKEGRSVIIFPEGTRVKPLESTRYNPGIIAIKRKFNNIPIIPVALNSGMFWSKSSWLKYPGTVIFKILQPLNTNIPDRDFLAKLEKVINSSSNELCEDLKH